jgi:hypothetical protein
MSCVRYTKVGSDELWLGVGRQKCEILRKEYGIIGWIEIKTVLFFSDWSHIIPEIA